MYKRLVESYIGYRNKIILSFLEVFINNMNLDIDLNTTPINNSQDRRFDGIYIRKETHDINFPTDNNIDLFIDCIDNVLIDTTIFKRYYHVTWAALTYYVRNVDKSMLLKSLKEIYPLPKSEFCSYMFRNNSYRNGVKRYNFFKISFVLSFISNFSADQMRIR